MGLFGHAVAFGVNFKLPLDSVREVGIRVFDCFVQIVIVFKDVFELVILWHYFMDGVKAMFFWFVVQPLIEDRLDVAD